MQLLAGVGFFGTTVLVAANTVELNGTPTYTKSTGFVTTTPELIEAVAEAEEEEIAEAEASVEVEEESAAAEAAMVAAAEEAKVAA